MSRRPKKLCMVIPTHWSFMMGGAEYQAKCLMEHLVSKGDLDLYYVAKFMDPDYRPRGYRLVRVGNPNGNGRYLHCLDGPDLYRTLARIDPDVIFQHHGCAYTGIAAFFARRRRRRMVWHVASDRDVTPRTGLPLPREVPDYIDKRLVEYGIRHADVVTVQTFRQGESLQRYYGRIPDGVVRNFHPVPEESPEKSEPVKVVWVANFKPLKQPEVFIRLARDLLHLGNRVEFVMAGAPASWDSQWQSMIEQEIQTVPNLKYVGLLSMDDVNVLLARSHLLVNTSQYEGFPNTFIQAWMREVPVVSLQVDPDGILTEAGVGCCAGSYERMVSAVRDLIADPSRRREMGRRARNYAAREFSEANMNTLIRFLCG